WGPRWEDPPRRPPPWSSTGPGVVAAVSSWPWSSTVFGVAASLPWSSTVLGVEPSVVFGVAASLPWSSTVLGVGWSEIDLSRWEMKAGAGLVLTELATARAPLPAA